jgi:CheY-like chemotaxis protein
VYATVPSIRRSLLRHDAPLGTLWHAPKTADGIGEVVGAFRIAVRLLIVEDSELIRKMTSLAFPSKEHELHEAENGLKALALLSTNSRPFDAIVLDLRMPDMNGVEFLRALRQRALHGQTPVVVATSERDDSPLLAEVRQMGVAAIVKKPWKPRELAEIVQRACSASETKGDRPRQ